MYKLSDLWPGSRHVLLLHMYEFSQAKAMVELAKLPRVEKIDEYGDAVMAFICPPMSGQIEKEQDIQDMLNLAKDLL